MQHLPESYHLIIYACAYARGTYLRVYVVSHVEYRSPLRELQQVALRREHVDLVLVQVHLELVHRLAAVARFQHLTDGGQPVVHAALALHAFVAPMGSHTSFGHFVHALGSYLYLHPLLFRA